MSERERKRMSEKLVSERQKKSKEEKLCEKKKSIRTFSVLLPFCSKLSEVDDQAETLLLLFSFFLLSFIHSVPSALIFSDLVSGFHNMWEKVV